MKKQFLSMGKALNKAEQKLINGGGVSGTGDCLDSNGRVYAVIPCDSFCLDGSRPFCYA